MAPINRSLLRTGGCGPLLDKASSPRSPRNACNSRRQAAHVSRWLSSSWRWLPVSSTSAYSARSSANWSCVFITQTSSCKLGAQLLESTANASFNRAQRLACFLGDFRVCQALKKCQLHGLALLGTHQLERAAHFLDEQSTLGLIPQIGTADNDAILDVGFRAPLAQPVDRAMTGDHRQPRGQASPAGIEGVGIAPQLQENVLQYILGAGGILKHTQRHRIHNLGIPVVELGHRMLVPGAYARYQPHLVSRIARQRPLFDRFHIVIRSSKARQIVPFNITSSAKRQKKGVAKKFLRCKI